MSTLDLEAVLVCAVCHNRLAFHEESARCTSCGIDFPRSGQTFEMIPTPLPVDVAGSSELWERLQENGLRAYEADPRANLSVGFRSDAHTFGRFAELRGSVLDVGCGPQRNPSYRLGRVNFYGVDPLRGEPVRSFQFVQALGEYLPFRDGQFDRVLFATSLDHLMRPNRALREARRVLAPGGHVAIWLGENGMAPDPNAARWLKRLGRALRFLRHGDLGGVARMVSKPPAAPRPETPSGAVDPFHFAHLTREVAERWLDEAGLRVVAVETQGPSVFLRAIPVP